MPVNDNASKVSSYLSKASYHYAKVCMEDILEAMDHYKGLKVKLNTFYFDDGKSSDIIVLKATLHITHRYLKVIGKLPTASKLEIEFNHSTRCSYYSTLIL